jgi:hypothetical protein
MRLEGGFGIWVDEACELLGRMMSYEKATAVKSKLWSYLKAARWKGYISDNPVITMQHVLTESPFSRVGSIHRFRRI